MAPMRWILVTSLLLLVAAACGSRRPKRFVAFRKGSAFIYRLNYKVNMLPYTTMFAQASGFKVGWQLPESTATSSHSAATKPKRRRVFARLSPIDLRDGARLLYDSHDLDGRACLMRSLCQTMRFVSKRDGVLAKILNLMAGSNGANNATSALDPLVCAGSDANDCPLHALGPPALFAHH